MMRRKNQKKMSCAIGAFTALASIIFLSEEARGVDILIRKIQTLEGEKEKVRTELQLQVGTLQETLGAIQEKNLALEQNHQKAQEAIAEIKEATGGSGTGTPILSRLKRINENNRALTKEKSAAEEELIQLKKEMEVLQQEKESLKRKNIEAESQLAAVRDETGGGGDTPLPERLQKFRKALEAELAVTRKEIEDVRGTTSVLAEEAGILAEKLKEEQESKARIAEDMGKIIADKDKALNALSLKYKTIKQEAKSLDKDLEQERLIATKEIEDARGITSMALEQVVVLAEQLKEERELMQETIIDKEEAYNNLYVEFLGEKSQADDLDKELSIAQVAQLKTKEELYDVLRKQFNVPINLANPVKAPK